jgi:hypothetical protein
MVRSAAIIPVAVFRSRCRFHAQVCPLAGRILHWHRCHFGLAVSRPRDDCECVAAAWLVGAASRTGCADRPRCAAGRPRSAGAGSRCPTRFATACARSRIGTPKCRPARRAARRCPAANGGTHRHATGRRAGNTAQALSDSAPASCRLIKQTGAGDAASVAIGAGPLTPAERP